MIFSGGVKKKKFCSKDNITKSKPVIKISSDASSFGGELLVTIFASGGAFSLNEMEYNINAKELLAVKFSLKPFVKSI